MLQVARELDAEEALAPHMESVLKGKRLLLFQKLLNSVGHEDTALIRDMCQGFSLVVAEQRSHGVSGDCANPVC